MPSKTFLNDIDKGVEGVLIKFATDANLKDNSKHFGDRIVQNSLLKLGKFLIKYMKSNKAK